MILAHRFRGPPQSANGGYSCGMAASLIDGPAEVTLKSPPPLDVELAVERDQDSARLVYEGKVVAEARPTTIDLEAPAPPSYDEAVAASARYAWRENHPYPSCFVCGPQRTAGDGLCIYPGPVTNREIVAAPFVPSAADCEGGLMKPEIVWATLDCPSWFGYQAFNDFNGMILLGRLAARIDDRPRAGEKCICVGWFLSREGRKIHCGSALYSEAGKLFAVGRATWIVLK
jgi:hypothetical protein